MFGDDILVAPKINEPEPLQHLLHKTKVEFYLPEHRDRWYNYMTKREEKELGVWQTKILDDLD